MPKSQHASSSSNTIVAMGYLEKRTVSQGKPVLMSPGKQTKRGWQKRWFQLELQDQPKLPGREKAGGNGTEDSKSPAFFLCSYKRPPPKALDGSFNNSNSYNGSRNTGAISPEGSAAKSPRSSFVQVTNLREFKVQTLLRLCFFVFCCFGCCSGCLPRTIF